MWFFIALLSAFFDASKNVLTKHKIHRFHSLTIAWTWMVANVLLLVPLMFLVPWPNLTQELWGLILIGVAADLLGLVLYIEGLRHCDLSLSLPLLALSPPILTLSSFWLNGELPNLYALLGILLVVMGIYFLNFKRHEHWFEPILAIGRQRGTRLIAAAALIWGLSGGLHKAGIVATNPFFYGGVNALLVLVFLTPIVLVVCPQEMKRVWKPTNLKVLLPIAILDSLSILTQLLAKSMTFAVFAISVKRTGIIMAVLLAWLFLGERIKSRILPILVLVAGVIVIALSQYFP